MKSNPILSFVISLLTIAGLAFFLHLGVLTYLGKPLFDHSLILSYGVNIFLAVVVYVFIYRIRNKQATNLGFIYMAGSGIKFLFFFLLFHPSYKADGEMERAEFLTFFVPYAICLIVETTFLVRLLNRLDMPN